MRPAEGGQVGVGTRAFGRTIGTNLLNGTEELHGPSELIIKLKLKFPDALAFNPAGHPPNAVLEKDLAAEWAGASKRVALHGRFKLAGNPGAEVRRLRRELWEGGGRQRGSSPLGPLWKK